MPKQDAPKLVEAPTNWADAAIVIVLALCSAAVLCKCIDACTTHPAAKAAIEATEDVP